jgi:hypothetical protein
MQQETSVRSGASEEADTAILQNTGMKLFQNKCSIERRCQLLNYIELVKDEISEKEI